MLIKWYGPVVEVEKWSFDGQFVVMSQLQFGVFGKLVRRYQRPSSHGAEHQCQTQFHGFGKGYRFRNQESDSEIQNLGWQLHSI